MTDFEIIDMNEPQEKIKSIWKERKTKSGRRMFYKIFDNKYVNIGWLKTGYVYVSYDNQFIKKHGLRYINDEQIKNDTDELLLTLFHLIE